MGASVPRLVRLISSRRKINALQFDRINFVNVCAEVNSALDVTHSLHCLHKEQRVMRLDVNVYLTGIQS